MLGGVLLLIFGKKIFIPTQLPNNTSYNSEKQAATCECCEADTGWFGLIWVDSGWFGIIHVDSGWYRMIRVDNG